MSAPREVTINFRVEDTKPVRDALQLALKRLSENQQQFAFYAANHRAKGGYEALQKAETNDGWARLNADCAATILRLLECGR